MIVIDGSHGEGGGQILRTSVALSLITGKPFRIDNIRGKRRKPGLLRQHLTAVNGAKLIGGARVEGDRIGSRILEFEPGAITPGTYNLAVGTAGSATLVLQTILPALLIAEAPSRLILEGGTHNPFAPCFDFLDKVFLPLINRMGPRVSAEIERYGFYPAGGGKFEVKIQPAPELTPLEILDRGAVRQMRAEALVCKLPAHIAERELKKISAKLSISDELLTSREVYSPGPGNVLQVEVQSEKITELFVGFGERGVSAERVASKAADAVREYLVSGAPVARYLADQLLLPLAIAGSGSFLTLSPSRHTLTNIEVMEKFVDVTTSVEQVDEKQWRIAIHSGC